MSERCTGCFGERLELCEALRSLFRQEVSLACMSLSEFDGRPDFAEASEPYHSPISSATNFFVEGLIGNDCELNYGSMVAMVAQETADAYASSLPEDARDMAALDLKMGIVEDTAKEYYGENLN